MLSFRKRSVLATFISSIMSQKRSTTSCMVFSQTPFKGMKMYVKLSIKFELIKDHYLVAEASYAGCSVGQHIWRFHGEASLVDAHATATLAGVHNDVTHAALQALRLAIRHTLAIAALASLLANGAVGHGRRFGALSMGASATCLLLTGGVLCLAALHSCRHELTVLAARRVLVTAHGALIAA